MQIGRVVNGGYGLVAVVGLLCVCVFAQVLGMPGTVIDLLTSSDILMETVSEDASLGQMMPEPVALASSRILNIVQISVHRPIFVTSIFRPPSV